MTERSEIETLDSHPRSRGDLAAARLASHVTGLFERVDERSSVMHKDIAKAMGVTPGRVSQLLCGDGNLRVGTLARLLDAFGYELSLTARRKDGAGEAITVPSRGRQRRGSTEAEPALAEVGNPPPATKHVDAFIVYLDATLSRNLMHGTRVDMYQSGEAVSFHDFTMSRWDDGGAESPAGRPARRTTQWTKKRG